MQEEQGDLSELKSVGKCCVQELLDVMLRMLIEPMKHMGIYSKYTFFLMHIFILSLCFQV